MIEEHVLDQVVTTSDGLPCATERGHLGQGIWMLLLLREWRQSSDIYVRSGESIRATELGRALGIGERQARRELQRLSRAGYLELQNTGRGFRIRVLDAPIAAA